MGYERTFNYDLSRVLAKATNPEEVLEKEIQNIKMRAIELNQARIEMSKGFDMVLKGLGKAFPHLDLNDPNFTDSPNRMARALLEISSGLGVKDEEILSSAFPAQEYDQAIILKDIAYTSMCSHHFYPFTGVAHIGYLPNTEQKNGKVVGISKLARIVDAHAARPQLQEKLCQDVMNAINQQLTPAGVIVVVEGQHGCLSCRGAKKTDAKMMTTSVAGKFKTDSKMREEFLSLISKK